MINIKTIMSSIQDINAQIAEYEEKIEDLKHQRKIINFKQFINQEDLKKMEDIEIEVIYNYRESDDDEYAHWTNAKLSLKFTFEGKYKNNLTINYSEEQGYHTESRYTPTIICNELEGTRTAKRILLKKLDFEYQDFDEFISRPLERHDNDWFKIRDMIEEING